MRRLVYNPRVDAFIRTDYGDFDISPYIARGRVARKIDEVSEAELTIRNPDFKFTEHRHHDSLSGKSVTGPVFHPMDPIVIALTRLHDRPIQVFTGFLDTTPYLQLFPGTITLQASCTLKKLLHTYFDPGLPFFSEFLGAHGWAAVEGLGVVNQQTPNAPAQNGQGTPDLTDSGFGKLLLDVLTQIGNWDADNIYIEGLPEGLPKLVTKLFHKTSAEAQSASDEFDTFINSLISSNDLGNSSQRPSKKATK